VPSPSLNACRYKPSASASCPAKYASAPRRFSRASSSRGVRAVAGNAAAASSTKQTNRSVWVQIFLTRLKSIHVLLHEIRRLTEVGRRVEQFAQHESALERRQQDARDFGGLHVGPEFTALHATF